MSIVKCLVWGCLSVVTLAACGGGGSDGDQDSGGSTDAGLMFGDDGDIMVSTNVIRYGLDAYDVNGSINPAVSQVSSGETVTFSISTDAQSRIYAVDGCGGTLNGNQYVTGAITEDCTVVVELYRQSVGADIVDIAAGSAHSVLLSDAGEVYVVGTNPDAETCVAENAAFSETFVMLEGIGVVNDVQACGARTFLTSTDGTVNACGLNNLGQLGIDDSSIERQYGIAPIALSAADSIRCGGDAGLAKLPDNALYAFGRGGLGIDVGGTAVVHTPTMLTSIDDIGAFDMGDGFAVAAVGLSEDLYVWGARQSGQLGDGFTDITTVVNPDGSVSSTGSLAPTPPTPLPIMLTNLGPVKDIASGGSHTLVLLEDKSVWAWGDNGSGQLGNGATSFDPLTPIELTGLPDIQAIEAIGNTSLVLDELGNVYTFGSGIIALGDSLEPYLIRGLPPIVQIHSGGGEHVLALADDGSVWGWGNSVFNQLAIGINDLNILEPILIYDGEGAPPVVTNPPTDPPADPPAAIGSLILSGSGASEFPANVSPEFTPTSYEGLSIAGITTHSWTFANGSTEYTLSYVEGVSVSLLRTINTAGGSEVQGFSLLGSSGVTSNNDGTISFVNVGPLQGTLDENPTGIAQLILNGTLSTNFTAE